MLSRKAEAWAIAVCLGCKGEGWYYLATYRLEDGMRIAVGQTLGRYRIEEEIGAGGMGVVYRAYDEKLERDLAIKVLSPGTLDNEAARKRFRNEARVLSRLNHPAIQTIHDFDTVDGTDFLVSELVPGTSLDTRLASGPLAEKEVVRIGVQLAQGIAAAHAAGILHRDLKPANLRVTPEGHLKILDFGLATLSQEAVMSLSMTVTLEEAPTGVSGTLPYMSPEQLLGDDIDERSDLYAAGVTLFQLVTGKLPFYDPLITKLTNAVLHLQPPLASSYAPNISPELERIILKCLEKDRDLRYQSAKDLAADLRRMETVSVQVATVRTRTLKSRPKGMHVLGAALFGLVLIVASVWWVLRQREEGLASKPPRWEQLTNFGDSAQIPAVSPDGKVVAFLRGKGDFGPSANYGQVWFKTLPDGDPVQLTNTPVRKQTLSFSPDGTHVYFTQLQGPFEWNTVEVPLLGAREPKAFMANATGLSWIGAVHFGAPFITWTGDEKTVFVSLRYFGLSTVKTLVIPTSPGTPPPAFVKEAPSDEELRRIPGARLINDESVYPGPTRERYVTARQSAKTNLFRIYLSK